MKKPQVFAVEVAVDRRAAIKGALERLAKTAVYVGIPTESKGDKRPDGEPITNSELGYIHEFGSPAAHIPARPFLRPGVQKAEGWLRRSMRNAAACALTEDEDGFERQLETVALKAETAVKDYMTSASFESLATSTVKRREAKIKKLGSSDMTIKPLIDTGNLRNAIVGVVVKE